MHCLQYKSCGQTDDLFLDGWRLLLVDSNYLLTRSSWRLANLGCCFSRQRPFSLNSSMSQKHRQCHRTIYFRNCFCMSRHCNWPTIIFRPGAINSIWAKDTIAQPSSWTFEGGGGESIEVQIDVRPGSPSRSFESHIDESSLDKLDSCIMKV